MTARGWIVVAGALVAAFARCQPGVPPPPRPSPSAEPPRAPLDPAARERARFERIAGRLQVLSRDVIAFWKKHGPDREHGGFHGTLARDGEPIEPTDKSLIQQTRHLWTMSVWYSRREASPAVKALADDLYRFVVRHFRDGDEYVFKVKRDGSPLETTKLLYAESFAIFALAEYSRVFGVPEARERALACFRSIDARAHDPVHGGYDQRSERAWLSDGAAKETNTHLHLLESFTTLYEVTRDETVRARLEELLRVFTDHVAQPADYNAQEFLLDWRRFGEPTVNYGHDLETAWLLLEALRVLGRPEDARVRETARRIAAHSARAGYDERLGGYFEAGPSGGLPQKLEKAWWVQAEAIPGLYRLHELTRDPKALDRLEGTLDFIEKVQWDREFGEWYWSVLRDGRLGWNGGNKGGDWKASYHSTRALVFTEDWIREGLKKAPSAAH